MPHCAARSGLLIQRRNRRHACRCAALAELEQVEIAAAGRAAALLVGRQHRHAERELRVGADVRQIAGGGPDHRHLLFQEIARRGAPFDHARRMRLVFRAEIDPVAQRLDAGRTGEVGLRCRRHWRALRRPRSPAPGTASTANPVPGICTPHRPTSAAIALGQLGREVGMLLPGGRRTFRIQPGSSGTRPCSRYSTIVERWNGTPQVWPAIWPFFRNAG